MVFVLVIIDGWKVVVWVDVLVLLGMIEMIVCLFMFVFGCIVLLYEVIGVGFWCIWFGKMDNNLYVVGGYFSIVCDLV